MGLAKIMGNVSEFERIWGSFYMVTQTMDW